MAAPHVAGLLGLMKALQPALGADEAERILKETADPTYRCEAGCGAGLINPVRALQAVGGEAGDRPLLSVPVSRVDIGSQEKASLQLANVGGAPLDWTAKVGGPEGARIALSDEAGRLEAGGRFALGIEVDRSGLPDGAYQATLELSAPSGKHVIALLFTVGEVELVDVGAVTVLTFRYDYAGELESGGEATTDAAQGYRFRVSTEPGPWFLAAMVDADGDGVLAGSDLLGFWPNNSQPKLVELGAGETRADLDFVLEPVGVEEVKDPDCAELRRCWEACGWERPCVDACPVSEACSTCYSQEVDPCVEQTSCEDCCRDCRSAYDTCFGPQFCADVDEGAGGTGGGDPGAGGSGGAAPCPRPDDSCVPLDLGVGACWPI